LGRRMCVRIGIALGLGCWQDTGLQAVNRRCPACHLGKPRPHRPRDSCRLITTRPCWRAMSAGGRCRICKWLSPRWPFWRSDRPPGTAAASRGRMFAGGALGALRRRCQCGAGLVGALRRSGAGLRRGAALRAAASCEKPRAAHGTRPLAGRQGTHPRL
jgi:hypothetical protein